MRRMRDFWCPDCKGRTEALVDDHNRGLDPVCSDVRHLKYPVRGPMERVISVPHFKLEGWSGQFPTATARFDRVHQEATRVANKQNEGKYE